MSTTSIYDFTKLTYAIQFWSCVIICPIGWYANLVNIVVCCEKEMQKFTISFYNIFMSIFNMVSLACLIVLLFPQSIGNQALYLRSNMSCKIIPYAVTLSQEMSAWLSVMVTFDRLIYISYQNRFKFLKEKNKIACLLGVLFFILSLSNIPSLFYSLKTTNTLDSTPSSNITVVECTASPSLSLLRNSLAIVMRTIFPMILQYAINGILIYNVFKRGQESEIQTENEKQKEEKKFARTIIYMNIFELVIQAPVIVCFIVVTNFGGLENTFISTKSNQAAFANLAFICSYILLQINYVSLLFVNMITSDKFHGAFRKYYLNNTTFKEIFEEETRQNYATTPLEQPEELNREGREKKFKMF